MIPLFPEDFYYILGNDPFTFINNYSTQHDKSSCTNGEIFISVLDEYEIWIEDDFLTVEYFDSLFAYTSKSVSVTVYSD